MRGISSSPSCSSSFENRATMVDELPVLSEAVFETVTVEWSPIVLLIDSNIFDGSVGGGGGFIEMTDVWSLGSSRGKVLLSRKFSVGAVVKLSVIETSCTICGWLGCIYVNPRVDNTSASSSGSSALKSESDST